MKSSDFDPLTRRLKSRRRPLLDASCAQPCGLTQKFVPDEFSPQEEVNALRKKITNLYHADETICVAQLLAQISLPTAQQIKIAEQAADWIKKIRSKTAQAPQLNTFLVEYSLSTEEGIALMALAESLLRIPDTYNVDRLIEEQLSSGHWAEHKGHSPARWVNAATWGLLLSGKILHEPADGSQWSQIWHNLLSKTSKPFIRKAVKAALQVLGQQFVLGKTLNFTSSSFASPRGRHCTRRVGRREAAGEGDQKVPTLYSYDMLGEAAYTKDEAQKYFQDYNSAIKTLAQENFQEFNFHNPGISVKFSALHPRFEFTQQERLHNELLPRVLQLMQQAKAAKINVTIDAEEAVRLDITLDIFAALISDPSLRDWNGLGLAIQAYQKRAPAVIDWVIALAHQYERRIPVRLVKGAYWDSEIKYAQEQGFDDYPVYTRRQSTDVSYLVCAQKLLTASAVIYPQFGTHNAYTVAAILSLAENHKDFEWQRLHGMGAELYAEVIAATSIPCRIYAPIGQYEVLLPYLARRLLENGANSSFVHQIADTNIAVEQLTADPITVLKPLENKRHHAIPLPRQIFPDRLAAQAYDFSDRSVDTRFVAHNKEVPPFADAEHVSQAITQALIAYPDWNSTSVAERAACLLRAADLLEQNMPHLIAIVIDEAGKTIPNAQAEVREAVDYCRYYAQQALHLFSKPERFPGPTGEVNQLSYAGRGAMVCISPWNFPLAIFLGQITAALVAGNTVLAKPAEQTPRIAAAGVGLLHAAGVPKNVLQLLCGTGETVGAQLVSDARIAGVIFTGSTATARSINLALANRDAPIVPFIAETGGINALVVDSTALLQQAVHDTLLSAFDSAGQRCSAARILLVQSEIADDFLAMLVGAMAELRIADPSLLNTDIGPVIDREALTMLQNHQSWLDTHAKLIYQMSMDNCDDQTHPYFAPCVYELNSIDDINQEIFGPILHVVRYDAHDLLQQLEKLQTKGYGLTFGMHTRLLKEAKKIAQQLRVGNIYINRTMIGAVVGSQPFGGQGLSGTGPKAGGPHYLMRLVTEKVVSVNTTASGGNATLLQAN
jgi:RHH-type proline utilization regulon transcriptional repressor/proline dehydrogenase/delta 1-pyrroline-5-carboxylate dehydrogenase